MKGQMMTLIKLIKSRHKYQEEERGQRSEKKIIIIIMIMIQFPVRV